MLEESIKEVKKLESRETRAKEFISELKEELDIEQKAR